jgi:hypothetical protein
MKEYGMGGGKPKVAKKATPVKVKSSTIGAIKKTGMTKALGNITPAQRKNAAYMTGLKRMYGAARVNKALGGGNRAVPVGGVMGTKRAQVMAGPVRSTKKTTTTKKVVKSGGLGAGVSVPVSMRTKSSKKTSMFNKKVPRYTK